MAIHFIFPPNGRPFWTSKHPELIATHRRLGERLDVEAKSRHRPGVLGRSGDRTDDELLKSGIRRKLNQACEKARNRPLVVFLDFNLPPAVVPPQNEEWINEARREIAGIAIDSGGVWPFALLVATNYAEHYAAFGETDFSRLHYIHEPMGAVQHSIRNSMMVDEIDTALRQYGNIPNEFPDDFRS